MEMKLIGGGAILLTLIFVSYFMFFNSSVSIQSTASKTVSIETSQMEDVVFELGKSTENTSLRSDRPIMFICYPRPGQAYENITVTLSTGESFKVPSKGTPSYATTYQINDSGTFTATCTVERNGQTMSADLSFTVN